MANNDTKVVEQKELVVDKLLVDEIRDKKTGKLIAKNGIVEEEDKKEPKLYHHVVDFTNYPEVHGYSISYEDGTITEISITNVSTGRKRVVFDSFDPTPATKCSDIDVRKINKMTTVEVGTDAWYGLFATTTGSARKFIGFLMSATLKTEIYVNFANTETCTDTVTPIN